MRRTAGMLAVAAGIASLVPGTAHATPTQTVTAQFVTTVYQKVGAGYLAASGCRVVVVAPGHLQKERSAHQPAMSSPTPVIAPGS